MQRLMLGLAGLLAVTGSAQAACSTSSLAGKWTLVGQDQVCVATVQLSGVFGAACSSPPNYSGTITETADCKISGTANGIVFKGRTNPIAAGAAAKPTLIVGASTNGAIAFTGFRQ